MPKSSYKKTSIIFMCQDTGAANAFAAFFLALRDSSLNIKIIATKSAIEVFEKKNIPLWKKKDRDFSEQEVGVYLDEFNPQAVVIGTSLNSWTERYFCKQTKMKGIFCFGFVDWWSNFSHRFSTPATLDMQFIPDQIGVIDEIARKGCIAEGIPDNLLKVIGNPYWDYLVSIPQKKIAATRVMMRKKFQIKENEYCGIIFSSNIRNLNLNLGYDEIDFFKSITPLPLTTATGNPIHWYVKPHPIENATELRAIMKKNDINAALLERIVAFDALALGDYIVGMCSTTLFEAALLHKKVISLQPGLFENKLKYLSIFDILDIPKITQADKVRENVFLLINSDKYLPDLNRLPFSIGKGIAAQALYQLISIAVSGKTGCDI
jgi:hypothetical protein